MKKTLPLLLIGALILLVVFSFLSQQKPQEQADQTNTTSTPLASPSLDPSMVGIKKCSPEDISAYISFEGAAGTVYATATLTNTSDAMCQIQANNFIAARYQASKENIQITNTGSPTLTLYELTPKQSLTAQVSYPNGPQCTAVTQFQTTFTYDLGEGDVTFEDSDKKTAFTLQGCQALNEITTITISPFTASK